MTYMVACFHCGSQYRDKNLIICAALTHHHPTCFYSMENAKQNFPFQRSELAPVDSNADATSASPPPITIKDEPIDEGYNAALLPQSSARQIKEELEQQDVRVCLCEWRGNMHRIFMSFTDVSPSVFRRS